MASFRFMLAALTGTAASLCASWVAAQAVATATGGSSTELAEIIVTATRRSESIQNVPSSVTALTSGTLDQIKARDLNDFAGFVPGLSFASTGPSTNLLVIRGITTGSQLSSATGVYLDDIPLGASTSNGVGYQSLNINAFDLNRIEVLNGPQGTLYGATSLGGTIRYIPNAPNLYSFGLNAGVEVSSTEHGHINHAYTGMVNMPIADVAAIRIDGYQVYDSGYAKDPIYGRDNQGWARSEGGRVALLLKPTDDLDITLRASTQHIPSESADVGFRDPKTHQPTYGTYDQAYPTFQPSNYSLTLYSAAINYDTPWAKFSSITGLQTNNGTSYTDNSLTYDAALGFLGAAADPWSLYVNTTTKKFTQEFRVASHENTTFQWLAGAFLSNEKTSEVVDLFDNANPGGTILGISPFTSFLPSTYREYAAYADGTIFFTKQLELGLGVRYSRQKQAYEETVSGLLATGSYAVLTPPVATSDQSVMTYLINPKFHITDEVMVYARAASGFRPGGPNFVLSPGLGNPTYDPDRLWSYELGEKATFLDKRATLNFDVYDILWKDIQVTVNVGGVNQLENAGTARVTGAEMSFDYRIIPALTLGGSAAYTNARLSSTPAVIDVTTPGVRLPLSPRFNFALIGTYDVDLTGGYQGSINVTDRWIGERNAGFGTPISQQYVLSSYNITDLNFSVRSPYHLEYGLFVRNVFDKAGEVSANIIPLQYNPAAPVQVFLAQPRTVGLSINYKYN
ncbi:MAG TPA: TonB-dependent receptor [Steroidobacteraceae bacterium]|nr:TonB-dependent receptor [Steroidobacteraceae bacterium]